MDLELEHFCEKICSSEFKCHWSKLDHRIRYMFPDGTTQTCVGSQVRCGCTLTMSLISHVTYEYPRVVMISLLFISTVVIYLLLRCIVVHQLCSVFCFACHKKPSKPCPASPLPAPRDAVISSLVLSDSSINHHQPSSAMPQDHVSDSDLFYVHYSDKPPAYSNVIREKESNVRRPEESTLPPAPPPSYAEWCGSHNIRINHI